MNTPPHIRARQQLITMMSGLTRKGVQRLPGERQLADELGVSLMTVKKAIRQLVLEDKLRTAPRDGHYICGARTTTDVGIVVGEGNASTFVRMPRTIARILQEIDRHGLVVRLISARDPDEALEVLARYDLQACLWYMPHATRLHAINTVFARCALPYAIVSEDVLPQDYDRTANLFAYDPAGVGRQRTEWMLARGHRRIACCTHDAPPIYDGFRQAMSAAGLAIDPALIIHHPEDVDRALPPLLGPDGVTAIIAEGGYTRQQRIFRVLDGHPWNARGELLLDDIGSRLAELRQAHPTVRITAVVHRDEEALAEAVGSALADAIAGRAAIVGRRILARFISADAATAGARP
ncbi:MAG: GntR family transcriptional regulator [Planctomycetes bacterium]|nr:GntR family transcriptional regulator [Planctomycetota bacterium]